MADHMEASLVCAAMRMALANRRPPPGLLFHSDRADRNTYRASFGPCSPEHHVVQSLSRPAQCRDNAVVES
jgi:putative transposase